MNKSQTFVDLCLNGEATLDEINDYVDVWHESSDSSMLHEYLGLEWEEYKLWVENPKTLKSIIEKRNINNG